MTSILDNPLIQSAVLPLLLSLGLTGLLRLVLGPVFGARLAAAAIAVSFLICQALIQAPVFPPRSSSQKLPYLVAGALLLGLLIDSLDLKARVQQTAMAVLALAGIGWLLYGRFDRIDIAGWILLPMLFAATLLAQHRCLARRDSLDGGILLLLASAGTGAIALIGASASMAQTCFALMAATGGFLLWNWPTLRFPLNATAQLSALTALLALGTQMLFYTKANGWALLLLTPLLLVDRIGRQMENQPLRAVLVTGSAVAICAVAVGTAWMMLEPSGSGY
ncbi:hypothetical protein GCM10011352_26410 [Marinobacterium zhoushanense]|uniref:EamA-like transporter family protein n=1 Tax=Marinobacterium zhoushanense TaxID=1679163 RepID=A0ABQ1KKT7_9GAMM|nr:hypothetical protein [Marinobacterium zhoushanense]GGB98968.1 hypothetical protein GCM10011352_26410 [Marinobacterium zhoushanense]